MSYELNYIQDIEIKKTIDRFIDSLISVKKTKTIYSTDFMNPKEIEYAISILNTETDVGYMVTNCPKNCENSIIIMWDRYCYSEEYINMFDYIGLLEIQTDQEISHRDILGAVLNLGINREKIGDIFTYNGRFYLCATNTMIKFLNLNLTKIKKFNISTSIVEKNIEKDEEKYKSFTGIINSERLDCLVSEMANISRKDAQIMIKNKKIKLNYEVLSNTSKSVEENSLVSIRGYGRYRLIEYLGNTKKDKLRIKYIKYI